MIKNIFIILVFTMLLLAQDQGATIKFDHDQADAGQIKQGEVAEHVFPFINEGADTLRISNVYSS